MRALKQARKLIEKKPGIARPRKRCRRWWWHWNRKRPFALQTLYQLDYDNFELALDLLKEWRLDRYYSSKVRLLDLSVQVECHARGRQSQGHCTARSQGCCTASQGRASGGCGGPVGQGLNGPLRPAHAGTMAQHQPPALQSPATPAQPATTPHATTHGQHQPVVCGTRATHCATLELQLHGWMSRSMR